MMFSIRRCFLLAASILILALAPEHAKALSLDTENLANYLIVGTGTQTDNQTVSVSNFEIGAITQPVPSPSDPTLSSSNPLPTETGEYGYGNLTTGTTNDGNVAVLSGLDNADTSSQIEGGNVNYYGDLGIQCSESTTNCYSMGDNNYLNPPPEDGTTEITSSQNITGGVDFTSLINELADAATAIEDASSTSTSFINLDNGTVSSDISTSGTTNITLDAGGQIQGTGANGSEDSVFVTTFGSGVHVVNILTNSDVSGSNATWIIDGEADTYVIFVLPDSNFLLSNFNILYGDGIGDQNIMFYQGNEDRVFTFNNTILWGTTFLNYGDGSSVENNSISAQNSQGCVQMIADQVSLSDVRYSRCAFSMAGMAVPEPASIGIFGFGLLAMSGFGLWSRRRRKLPGV